MNQSNIYGYFFKGEVRFIATGIMNAKYSLTANGSIIKVKNSVHVRLLHNLGKFPEAFEIIAPLEAVSKVNGEIPEEYIHYLPASEYLKLRAIYYGH